MLFKFKWKLERDLSDVTLDIELTRPLHWNKVREEKRTTFQLIPGSYEKKKRYT